MLAKTRRAERGQLTEPSVVETTRARLYGNIPNAGVGTLYYPALAFGVWVLHKPDALIALLAASALAAATSAYLAYSLLFITRMSCKYCWASHAVNWTLFACVAALFKLSYWR
jgi:uncharacterized membrane protein